MKKTISFLAIFISTAAMLNAQQTDYTVNKGDVLALGEAKTQTYQHIDFPKKNTIIKRGAIADFKTLKGLRVVVHEVDTSSDGITEVVLKRKDGKKFFRIFSKVKANYNKAIEAGELKTLDYKGQGAIAQY